MILQKRRIVSASIKLLLLCLLLALFTPRLAAAHGYLIRAIPDDSAVLEHSPARVQYWFSEPLEPAFSSLTVRDTAGAIIATGGTSAQNPNVLETRLPLDLPDGAYISDLRLAFASDGHVIAESRVFFVGDAVSGVQGSAGSSAPEPLEIIWRTALLSALILLLGAYALYALVLVPAWGSPTYPFGNLPPRVMKALNIILIAALAAAFGANILALLQQSMAFFGADLGRVLSEGLFTVVRTSTRFGTIWNARMIILIGIAALHGASLYFRDRQPALVRPFWTANAWGAALALGTMSVTSHAAGATLLPWAALFTDWLHLLGVALWAGGLAALALILPVALQPYHGEARRRALLAALNHFSPLAAACLILVIATGIFSAAVWITAPQDVTTRYGITLALKLFLVMALIGVAALHHAALRPERYQRFSGLAQRFGVRLMSLRLEVVLAMFVVISAAILSATPVPTPVTSVSTAAPSETIEQDDTTVTMTISPGGTGVNTYDVVILRDGVPQDDLSVRVQMVNPLLDKRSAWLIAESASDGLYISASNDLDVAGDWLTILEISGNNSALPYQRLVYEWTISPDAAVSLSRPPSLLNLLALVGVIVAGLFALFPLLRIGYRKLDKRAMPVAVALGASAAGVAVIIIGLGAAQSVSSQYQALTNPPPSVVNAVLPDTGSLLRGQALFQSACGWDALGGDWIELTRRLERMRDEALYAAIVRGWASLPACGANFTENQRWDIVNYVRSVAAQ
jgi:putative copper export protein/methionine-rich copper-binding protein CopC